MNYNTQNLAILSKETLVLMLSSLVIKYDTSGVMIGASPAFKALSNLLGGVYEPKTDEWIELFMPLNVIPTIDNPTEVAPDLTHEQLLGLYRLQANLTPADFDRLGLHKFQVYSVKGWNLLDYYFNTTDDEGRKALLAEIAKKV